ASKRQSYTPGQTKDAGLPTPSTENGDVTKAGGANGQVELISNTEIGNVTSTDDVTPTSSAPNTPSASSATPAGNLKRTGSGKRPKASKEANGIRPGQGKRPTSYPQGKQPEGGDSGSQGQRPQSLFLEDIAIPEDDGKIETVSLSSNAKAEKQAKEEAAKSAAQKAEVKEDESSETAEEKDKAEAKTEPQETQKLEASAEAAVNVEEAMKEGEEVPEQTKEDADKGENVDQQDQQTTEPKVEKADMTHEQFAAQIVKATLTDVHMNLEAGSKQETANEGSNDAVESAGASDVSAKVDAEDKAEEVSAVKVEPEDTENKAAIDIAEIKVELTETKPDEAQVTEDQPEAADSVAKPEVSEVKTDVDDVLQAAVEACVMDTKSSEDDAKVSVEPEASLAAEIPVPTNQEPVKETAEAVFQPPAESSGVQMKEVVEEVEQVLVPEVQAQVQSANKEEDTEKPAEVSAQADEDAGKEKDKIDGKEESTKTKEQPEGAEASAAVSGTEEKPNTETPPAESPPVETAAVPLSPAQLKALEKEQKAAKKREEKEKARLAKEEKKRLKEQKKREAKEKKQQQIEVEVNEPKPPATSSPGTEDEADAGRNLGSSVKEIISSIEGSAVKAAPPGGAASDEPPAVPDSPYPDEDGAKGEQRFPTDASGPTSPVSPDTSAALSPVSSAPSSPMTPDGTPVSPETGESSARSSVLRRIKLGPRLKTAILRKSSGAADNAEEKRVSLTQPRHVEVSDLTPPPRKHRPRRPLEQVWTPQGRTSGSDEASPGSGSEKSEPTSPATQDHKSSDETGKSATDEVEEVVAVVQEQMQQAVVVSPSETTPPPASTDKQAESDAASAADDTKESEGEYKVAELPSPGSRVSIHADPESPTIVSTAQIVLEATGQAEETPDTFPDADQPHDPPAEDASEVKTDADVGTKAKDTDLEKMASEVVAEAQKAALQAVTETTEKKDDSVESDSTPPAQSTASEVNDSAATDSSPQQQTDTAPETVQPQNKEDAPKTEKPAAEDNLEKGEGSEKADDFDTGDQDTSQLQQFNKNYYDISVVPGDDEEGGVADDNNKTVVSQDDTLVENVVDDDNQEEKTEAECGSASQNTASDKLSNGPCSEQDDSQALTVSGESRVNGDSEEVSRCNGSHEKSEHAPDSNETIDAYLRLQCGSLDRDGEQKTDTAGKGDRIETNSKIDDVHLALKYPSSPTPAFRLSESTLYSSECDAVASTRKTERYQSFKATLSCQVNLTAAATQFHPHCIIIDVTTILWNAPSWILNTSRRLITRSSVFEESRTRRDRRLGFFGGTHSLPTVGPFG
ncbi:hypothetical protein BaRGS_00017459, partial [Batillaria attramentaria]